MSAAVVYTIPSCYGYFALLVGAEGAVQRTASIFKQKIPVSFDVPDSEMV
jgi:hypothetical protein